MDPKPFDRSFLPVIDSALRRHRHRDCLVFRDQAFTYGEVDRLSAKIANRLIEGGFQPDCKGAVYSLNSALSFIATLGILRAGGVWIPVNPRNSTSDNVAILQQFGCDALFFQGAFEAPVRAFQAATGAAATAVCLDRAGPPGLDAWMAGASETPPTVSRAPTDLISIPLTGGTTGLPKGVMLSNRNFCALDHGMRTTYAAHDPVVLAAAPMTHVGGRVALCGLSSGTRTVIMETVDPAAILRLIGQHGVTDFFLPPTGIYALLDQPDVRDHDYASLKSFSYGSAPMALDRLKEAIEVFGPVMRGGFGQTECPMFIARLAPDEHFIDNDPSKGLAPDTRLGSVGRTTAISTIAILDDAGRELPSGTNGEIAVKGPMVSEGYYQSPEETAKVRVHGWHLTGDIGHLDEQGFLHIVDRKKDMIISGGFNVYSTEVEQALMRIDGIELAAVIGEPDRKWGEAVCAYVEVTPGAAMTPAEIMARTKADIGGVKAPKRVTIMDELPRTPVGKLDKKPLREAAWAGRERKI
ncbi:MAG: AMP-binding protein [Gammaproteobacteria bacterium]|nr:AMP-binding protein [Gammaproteobacteria bacterium]